MKLLFELPKMVREHVAEEEKKVMEPSSVVEQRSETRKETEELPAIVIDNSGFYKGVVANISQTGICFRELPGHISSSTQKLSVIIRDKTQDYCCFLTPSWGAVHPVDGQRIGGKISKTPENWSNLVAHGR